MAEGRESPSDSGATPNADAVRDERRFLESFVGRTVADGPAGSLELFDEVYGRLRELADRLLEGERLEHTLQATALVHEAWMKLAGSAPVDWNDAEHFFATAARSMRRVLVDHARGKGRTKRGGGWRRVPLDDGEEERPADAAPEALDPLALDRALSDLERESPRQARLVELRWFSGLSVAATARVLGVSEGTVARDWRFARAWLARRLGADG